MPRELWQTRKLCEPEDNLKQRSYKTKIKLQAYYKKHSNTLQLHMDVTVHQEVSRKKINLVSHSLRHFCTIASKLF